MTIYTAPKTSSGDDEPYSIQNNVFSYGILLYRMSTNDFKFTDNSEPNTIYKTMSKYHQGMMYIRPNNITDNCWNLINHCWHLNPNMRPTFEDDQYALNEFGQETNLDELHEYQRRIDSENEPHSEVELLQLRIGQLEEKFKKTSTTIIFKNYYFCFFSNS